MLDVVEVILALDKLTEEEYKNFYSGKHLPGITKWANLELYQIEQQEDSWILYYKEKDIDRDTD